MLSEAEFGTLFSHWLRENKPAHSENYEFKIVNHNSFSLRGWHKKQPHQPRSLKQASGAVGIFHKMSDMSMDVKPFDAFFTRDTPSLLVIWFNKYKVFFCIPVENIPLTDSISYAYCKEHFKACTLLTKKDLSTKKVEF